MLLEDRVERDWSNGCRKMVRTVPKLFFVKLYYYGCELFRDDTTPACASY